jgi:hypothetical protein
MLNPLSRESAYLGILQFLQMTLEMMKELFDVAHIREEEVPNMNYMRVGEEEVLLSQPVTTPVPPEEEGAPVPKSPAVVVPPEAEEITVLLQGPLSRSHQKEGEPSLSWSTTRAPIMKALYRPW